MKHIIINIVVGFVGFLVVACIGIYFWIEEEKMEHKSIFVVPTPTTVAPFGTTTQ